MKLSIEQIQKNLYELFKNGEYNDAEKLALSTTKEYPDFQFAWKVLASLYIQKGRFNESVNASNKSILLIPKDSEAHNNLALALNKLSRFEEAEASFKLSIKLNPNFFIAHFNYGFFLQNRGKLDESTAIYKIATGLNPESIESFINLGNVFRSLGRFEESEVSYKKALAIDPNYILTHFCLGLLFYDLGRLEEAEVSYKNIIMLNPESFEALNNLGNVLLKLNKLEEAEASFRKAIELNPNLAEPYCNLGQTYQAKGLIQEAIKFYITAIDINPNFSQALVNFSIALEGVRFSKPNKHISRIILLLLESKTYVRPSDVVRPSISLLKNEPAMQILLKKKNKKNIKLFLKETISLIYELPLFLKLMSICPLNDIDCEFFLKNIRQIILLSIDDIAGNQELLDFQSKLAFQCFINEYIYEQTIDEVIAIEKLENSIKNTLSKGDQPNPHHVLALASYKPLKDYKWREKLKNIDTLKNIYRQQVLEPELEQNLKSNIPILNQINNEVSLNVQKQYEKNPYPRWVNLALSLKPLSISEIINGYNLKIYDSSINKLNKVNILIAGCGTGQQSIGEASKFKNSNILAIDLSLSSLAYAKRKTEEYNFKNIDYMQADIMDLRKIKKQFDIIECVGVLHHMENPLEGWKVLIDCLKTGGLMNIGLYSELARKPIEKTRNEIKRKNIKSDVDSMKMYREEIIQSNKDHHKDLLKYSDFYSLSELRDLLFHVQEHRFNIIQVKEHLSTLGLKFCGFQSDKITNDFKSLYKNQDDFYKLDIWDKFEKSYPDKFMGMYQFWCQKVD